jgi:two-component system cell cycle sensor histidine kinase/response regulator CckA
MEAIGRLAGGIAHDFNNLLTVIIGRCELLFARAGEEQRAGLEEIKHAGEMAANLTRQLLVFARKQNPRPEVLDINSVTATAAETMIRRLIPENVELSLELSPQTAWVRADRSQVEQLILNLALNAQHAMPNGGNLEIGTSVDTLPEGLSAYGLAVPPGQYLCLTVKDTGVGIAPRVLPHLFDPFFTTKASGTGLGLATVYGIVRQSSGGVTVESDLGWGTVFRIYLPITEQAPAMSQERGSAPGPFAVEATACIDSGRRQRVLVVEDVPAIGTMLRKYLERQGYDVLQAVRPREALAIVDGDDDPIDLLITDVVMPEMNGPELARAIVDRRPEIKVLFVSGYAQEALHQQITESTGAFLRKPFALAELSKTVRSLLASASAAA